MATIKLPKRIYFTGVPGSRWSGIAQIIEDTPGFNKTDRTPSREYKHNEYSGHKGAYFGTGMDFPADMKNTDQAWTNPKAGCMLVKSHDWAYQLYRFTEEWTILVYRPDLVSYAWWHEAGGFKIKYPNYEWYKNSSIMYTEIQQQNKCILEYGKKHNLKWSYFTKEWMSETFGTEIDVPEYSDILITIKKYE